MALPLIPLILAGSAISGGVSAFHGRRGRRRLERLEREEGARDLGAEARGNVAGVLDKIRARAEFGKKRAFRAGLGDAAERGVAAGSLPGGVSGVAQQAIDPLVAEVEAAREREEQETITAELQRLEEERARRLDRAQAREAQRPTGIFSALFG